MLQIYEPPQILTKIMDTGEQRVWMRVLQRFSDLLSLHHKLKTTFCTKISAHLMDVLSAKISEVTSIEN